MRCHVGGRYWVPHSHESLSLSCGVVRMRARSKGPSGPFFGSPSFVVVWRRLNYFELDIELLKQSVHTALSEIELLSEGTQSVLA